MREKSGGGFWLKNGSAGSYHFYHKGSSLDISLGILCVVLWLDKAALR